MRTMTCPNCGHKHSSWEPCAPLPAITTDAWIDPRFCSESKEALRQN